MTQKKSTRKKPKAKKATAPKVIAKQVVGSILNLESEERDKEQKKRDEEQREAEVALKKLQVADGKSDIEKMKDLEEVLGVKQTNPFGTTSLAVLEETINDMGLSDLQAFAVRIGLLPSGNRLHLKNRIKKEFRAHPGAGAAYHSPIFTDS